MTERLIDTVPAMEGGIVLRPGAAFPDWSVIRSATAGEALRAITDAFAVETRWRGYGGDEDRVHVALLELYAHHGRAPTAGELAHATDLGVMAVTGVLTRLADRDMVVLDPDSGALTGAYPLTDHATGHSVTLGNRILNAMCAIDAVGAPAMYGIDGVIDSSCRHCGVEIRIATGHRGTSLASVSPPAAVVLVGSLYERCAANSLCSVIAFFCTDQHLEAWRGANAAGDKTCRLSLDDALTVGRALFGPFLAGVAGNPEIKGAKS